MESAHPIGEQSVFLPLVLRNEADEVYLHVTLLEEKVLVCNWKGFITEAQIQAALMQTLEFQHRCRLFHMLNDLTQVTGNWSQAIPWLAGEFQQLVRTRLDCSYGAMVVGNQVFSYLSAREMVSAYGQDNRFRTALFPSREPALIWLREQQL